MTEFETGVPDFVAKDDKFWLPWVYWADRRPDHTVYQIKRDGDDEITVINARVNPLPPWFNVYGLWWRKRAFVLPFRIVSALEYDGLHS